MKVFLATSRDMSESKLQIYSDLVKYVKSKHSTFHYERDLTQGHDKHSFDELVEEIGNADVFIAEMTNASQTLGFQLAHALRVSKQCLYLYNPDIKDKPDGLIGNIPSRNLKIKQYNPDNYRKVVDDFMSFAERQQESYRTSFMSTREIDEYLTKRSTETGVSKGEVIRELLHKSINS
jgi:hypothetical protein